MTDTTKPSTNNTPGYAANTLQAIAQFTVDLHVARRNFLIYPATHEQAHRSLTRAYERLSDLFANQPDVSLTVLRSGLAVGDKALSAKSPVFKDLATVLKQYQIVQLVFTKGLEKEELVRFLQLVVSDRDTIQSQGGIAKAMGLSEISHIHVKTVDYSQLEVTAEEKIDRSVTDENGQGSIWKQFVTRLSAQERQEGHGKAGSHFSHFDPEKLARMLNNSQMDVALAVEQYAAVLSAASNSSQKTEIFNDGLPQFQTMIKALSPVLQDQFLSATFGQCGQQATMADTAQLVDGLGGDLIIRMLAQASDQGKKISPSLLAFVKKMAQIKAPQPLKPAMGDVVTDGDTFGATEVNTLLDHEQYDQYVDSGYGELLEKIISHSQKGDSAEAFIDFKQALEADLQPVQISSQIGRAMTALMDGSRDIEGYRQWARQLTYMLDDLLENQAFVFLTHALNRFRDEKESIHRDKAKIAGLVLDRFNDPRFVARAVEMVQDMGDQEDPNAMEFFSALGEPVIVEIFEGLDPNDTFYAKECLESKLVDNLASFASCEALERLDDPRPEYVCRMIRIVRRMGDQQGAERVRPLIEHDNKDIRLEVLATLLKFKNKWGLIRLRDILEDPSLPEFIEAMALAGRYKVQEVMPQLIAYAERGGGDRQRQEAAVRALGALGDVRAVPVLAKLANQRWSISKKNKDHIKRVVYESLSGYPMVAVKDLLHCGLKEKDAAIQTCCEQVLRKHLKQ